jgi:hypothetical protein
MRAGKSGDGFHGLRLARSTGNQIGFFKQTANQESRQVMMGVKPGIHLCASAQTKRCWNVHMAYPEQKRILFVENSITKFERSHDALTLT